MPLLRTLGSVALVQCGPSGEQLLDVQQKRLALLVFLARASARALRSPRRASLPLLARH